MPNAFANTSPWLLSATSPNPTLPTAEDGPSTIEPSIKNKGVVSVDQPILWADLQLEVAVRVGFVLVDVRVGQERSGEQQVSGPRAGLPTSDGHKLQRMSSLRPALNNLELVH